MKSSRESSTVGRPRAFDPEKALESAMRVFWQKGYEGTSLSDLTEAMGINRPSLYAAFGNKEELFRRVLERYSAGRCDLQAQALAEPTARDVARRLLFDTIPGLTDARNPGCLSVVGALVGSDEAESVRRELCSVRATAECQLRDRFQRAKEEGDLSPQVDPADLARYVATVLSGMSVQARGGASADDLRRVAELALRAWPG